MNLRVGIVTFVTIVIAIVLILLVGDFTWFQDQYKVTINFPRAPGVKVDTPVRKNGVLIGRVTDVRLRRHDENPDYPVQVDVAIYADVPVYMDEVCQVGTGSLLGDAVLEWIPAAPNESLPPDRIPDGGEANGIYQSDPLDVVADLQRGLNTVITSVTRTSDDIGRLSRRLDTLIGDNEEQIRRLLTQSEDTLRRIGDAANNFNGIVGDPQLQEDLRNGIREIPQFARDARAAAQQMQDTLTVLDRNLSNLEGFTEPLGKRGEQILTNADQMFFRLSNSAENLDELLGNLVRFTRSMNNREGSLGRLLNDPTLYNDLVNLTGEVNRLAIELRPIIYDARVFSDKIARDPGVLGVSGALQNNDRSKPVRRQHFWPVNNRDSGGY